MKWIAIWIKGNIQYSKTLDNSARNGEYDKKISI